MTELSRDRTLFDSGFALGLNTGKIPLSGTGTAGHVVQARAYSTDDSGASSTNWVDIATVDDFGNWSGELSAPRNASWYRPDVRLKALPGIAAIGGNRFGVGHVIAFWGQSEDERFHSTYYDQTTAPALLNEDAVQYMYFDRAGSDGLVHTHVTDATPVSAAVAALANTLLSERPDDKFALVAQTHSGTSPMQMVNDSDTGRDWFTDKALHDYATADGQQVGLATWSWFAAPGSLGAFYEEALFPLFTGLTMDGAPFTTPAAHAYGFSGSIQYDHTFLEIYDPAYTRWAPLGPHRFDIPETMQDATHIANGGTEVTNLLNKQLSRESWRSMITNANAGGVFLPYGVEMLTYQNGVPDGFGGWTDWAHPAGGTTDGLQQRAKLFAHSIMQSAGMVGWDVPEFDHCEWEASGAYVEIWSSSGPITTTRLARGEAALDDSFAHWTDIAGWQINGIPAQRAEVVAGRVRIYPNSGTFTYADVINFGEGGASGMLAHPDDFYAALWENLPIVDVGATGLEGIPVRALPDPAVLANTLPASTPFFTTTATGPRFESPTNIPANTTAITIAGRVRVPAASISNDNLFAFTSTTFDAQILSSGAVRMTLEDSTGAKMVQAQSTADGVFPFDQWVDFEIAADQVNGWLKVRLNGVEVSEFTFTPGSGLFTTSRKARVLYQNSDSNQLIADVERVQIWYEATTDGSAPTTVPVKEISGDADTINADAWMVGTPAA
ncbi:hypothetical protein COL8621_03136 [Actibacterium lipolyticum]|uniref:Uncharacterized protein n=2 Tax=Actibacterium lipolyticum TaxID=1524263 RepID=A0A238KWN8_9RHOB|nr:hypothetical protein COL8621_03136 [Actibacterium lipolyticum]